MRTQLGSSIDRGRGKKGTLKIRELRAYVLNQSPNDGISVVTTRGYVLVQGPADGVSVSNLRTYVIVEP